MTDNESLLVKEVAIEKRLKEILGNTAFDNFMVVPTPIGKLVQGVNYTVTQMRILAKDQPDIEDDLKTIFNNLLDILTKS